MKIFRFRSLVFFYVVAVVFLSQDEAVSQRRHRADKQGFGMRMWINNVGAMGRVAIPPFNPNPDPPGDQLGLEYPIGQNIEHLFGGGLWIGGLLDTARIGTSTPLRLVTLSYEGWAGPYYEMFPGASVEDTLTALHVAERAKDTAKPAGWDAYWGGSLPFKPISDRDIYYTYNDTVVRPQGHVPMRLKVIQSTFAWNDPYAEAIIIMEYKIINMGFKRIDSAYIAFFFEPDIGPISEQQYWIWNSTFYDSTSRTAYSHNPRHRGSTPVGVTLLRPFKPRPGDPDTLRYGFRHFPGPTTPPNDAGKYLWLSSGLVMGDEFPGMSDTRFVFSSGPYFMKPAYQHTSSRDTLVIAVAVVSGYSPRIDHRIVLLENARRALDIYLNQGVKLPATPPSPPLRVRVGFRRVELDWKWRPGDDTLFGRLNPEANWDTTSREAERDPMRYQATHQYWDGCDTCWAPTDPRYGRSIDTTKGGRNFQAYRLWRSEIPLDPRDISDRDYTLLYQYDVRERPGFQFESETGLRYTFVDSNLVRGKVYVYAVTSLSIPNLVVIGGDTVPVNPLESAKNINAVKIELPFAVSEEAGKVLVVPNPYRTDHDYTFEKGGYEGLSGRWDESRRVVKFINLPEVCTIRIFSLAGDLIRTIYHDGRDPSTGFSRGDVTVPLVSESNRALASGIYLFTVESEFGTQTGKFVIIR